MPQTYRHYRVWQVVLSVEDRSPLASEAERALEGDIIAIRTDGNGVGMKEMHRWLWVSVYGMDDDLMTFLQEGVTEGDEFEREIYDKRRYSIPLARLQAIYPTLDMARVRDVTDAYQPFMPVDEDQGYYLEGSAQPPFDVAGLIFDKTTGRYI